MKIVKLIITITFFSIFFPANSQTTLRDTDIEKYLSTLPKIQSLITSSDPENIQPQRSDLNFQSENLTSRTPISDNLERMQNHPTYGFFSKIVKDAGFENPTHWAAIGDEIMMAYGAYLINNPPNSNAPTLEDMKRDLAEQLVKVEKNQFITTEHKELLLNKIQNSIVMLNDPTYIANENISIIRPYIGRLTSYLRNTNDTY